MFKRVMPLYLAGFLGVLSAAWAADREDLPIADFEGDTYGEWQVEGEAFGPGPARGTLPGQMPVSGFRGRGLVNSFYRGDGTTGRLLSPPFKIDRNYVNFLIGGGQHPGRACINLLLDGKVVRTASGPNDRPGGSENLEWHSWDVKELAGKSVRIEIVDQVTGSWGHINVDQIGQSDKKLATVLLDQRRTVSLDRRYLNFPVKNGAAKRKMVLLVEGAPVREFEIELADEAPDFWVFLDVSEFRGKSGILQVDRLPEGSRGLDAVALSDAITGAENLYREKLRPQFHFSSRRGWLNDPNGLVYANGEYHLYYQHNPYGWNWGNMHWGHAVSRDLVHWQELPIALYPARYGDFAFSGSAVVDRQNTAGFKKGKEDVIVAAYTSTGRGECIAYSNDGGRTFTDYPGNPVLRHEGRDPKVFWYAPGKHWVMVVYSVRDKKNGLLFLTSTDLKKWEQHDWLEGYFECPELVELSIDGDPKNKRWALFAADGAYALGRFDGKRFTPEGPKLPANWGNAFYAAQAYNDLPEKDGRRIRVGWAQVAIPGMPFNQMMNFPVELSLRTTDEGPRLHANPIREIEKLYAEPKSLGPRTVKPGENPLTGITGDLFDLEIELEPGTATEVGLKIRGVPLTYDVKAQSLTCLGKTAPLKPVKGKIRLRVLVDRTSLEIFGNDGRIYMPMGVIPADADRSLELFARGGEAQARRLEVRPLRSAWQ